MQIFEYNTIGQEGVGNGFDVVVREIQRLETARFQRMGGQVVDVIPAARNDSNDSEQRPPCVGQSIVRSVTCMTI